MNDDQAPKPENQPGARDNISTADLARDDAGDGTAGLARPERADKVETAEDSNTEPLFPQSETKELRDRWHGIQAAFVDEPRKAVQDADGLVAGAMKRLAEIFAAERDQLEGQWDRGDDVSTEDLRLALRKYRSFFDRLLSM